MEMRELAGTGEMVPEIGVGTWQYHGGIGPLQRGLDLGATLIDTAEIYGSEGIVGQALKGRRQGVFLATKVSGDHLRHDQVIKAADASLKRLGVETIDLYQVHWPDRRVPIGETMQAMEQLVDAGKVRYIGVSNFSRREVEAAQAVLKRNRIVTNQIEYSLQRREVEADFEFYRDNQITVIAYSPLGLGELLSNRNQPNLQTLRRVAAEAGKTPAQVALNWVLSRPGIITIPKSDRAERVEENCGASGWRLTPEQITTLEAAFPRSSAQRGLAPSLDDGFSE
jgi:diketogulonate reductase-like aldo/keto reductase